MQNVKNQQSTCVVWWHSIIGGQKQLQVEQICKILKNDQVGKKDQLTTATVAQVNRNKKNSQPVWPSIPQAAQKHLNAPKEKTSSLWIWCGNCQCSSSSKPIKAKTMAQANKKELKQQSKPHSTCVVMWCSINGEGKNNCKWKKDAKLRTTTNNLCGVVAWCKIVCHGAAEKWFK